MSIGSTKKTIEIPGLCLHPMFPWHQQLPGCPVCSNSLLLKLHKLSQAVLSLTLLLVQAYKRNVHAAPPQSSLIKAKAQTCYVGAYTHHQMTCVRYELRTWCTSFRTPLPFCGFFGQAEVSQAWPHLPMYKWNLVRLIVLEHPFWNLLGSESPRAIQH